jgi:hypothetical protein
MPAGPAANQAQTRNRPFRHSVAAGGEAKRRSTQPVALGRRTARTRRIDRFAVAAEVLENPLDPNVAVRLEMSIDIIGGVRFSDAFGVSVERYIVDYRLKPSMAQLLRQRQKRLAMALESIQVPMITTQMLREAVSPGSQFEQTKLKTLLLRFPAPTARKAAAEVKGAC